MTAPRALALRNRLLEEAVFLLSMVAFARWVVGLRRAGTFTWFEVDPGAYLRGEAPTPFQYRVMAAWLGMLIQPLVGDDPLRALQWVEAGAAVGLVIMFRVHMTGLLGGGDAGRRAAMVLTPLVALVLPFHYVMLGDVPGMTRYVFFAWDLPAAFTFLTGLYLLRTRRWLVYYAWFMVATLTKETSAFLTLAHLAVGYRRERDRTLLAHIFAQAGIWLTIKLLLRARFAANAGHGTFQDAFTDNVLFLMDPGLATRFLGSFGFLWVPVIAWARHIRDEFTRRALWIVPAWVVGMLRVGSVVELRVFGELLALFVPAWALLLREFLSQTAEPTLQSGARDDGAWRVTSEYIPVEAPPEPPAL